MGCIVCGSESKRRSEVLGPDLIGAWQLSPFEVSYIDRQQGDGCGACGANLRSMVLAKALLSIFQFQGTLDEAAAAVAFEPDFRILEINDAGSLSPTLRKLPGHIYGAYPEVDLHSLPYANDVFDVIVHSDTLEHVENPVHALTECLRVLKPGGHLCFTVPAVVGRLTRGRAGLSPSYHGDPLVNASDYLVHSEFGADTWTYVIAAGFCEVTVHALEFPVALAWTGRKELGPTGRDDFGKTSTASRYVPKEEFYEDAPCKVKVLHRGSDGGKDSDEVSRQVLLAELDATKRRIRELEESTSWRVTRPMRLLKEVVLGLRRE